MRFFYAVLFVAVIVPLAFGDSIPPCPGCDLPLRGMTIGGFFGGGTFSADADSPTVAAAMGIAAMPAYALRAGGAVYFYPGGRYRIGICGGYNWAGTEEGDRYIKTDALWGTILPELVRTAGTVRITGGLGIGGGMSTIRGSETGEAGEGEKEQIPMFVLLPKFGIELPFGSAGAMSVDFSYQCFFGEDRTATWGEDSELHFSPRDIGGPGFSLGLQFGKVTTAEKR